MKLCDLETSKVLQELGYDGEYQYCHVCTQHDGYQLMIASDCEKYAREITTVCAAPRLDDAAYWLREKYGFVIWLTYLFTGRWNPHLCDTNDEDDGLYSFAKTCKDYNEALEFAMKKAIEIIKEKYDLRRI